jgi:uncharacterized protein YdiU (UPF0061 family)
VCRSSYFRHLEEYYSESGAYAIMDGAVLVRENLRSRVLWRVGGITKLNVGLAMEETFPACSTFQALVGNDGKPSEEAWRCFVRSSAEAVFRTGTLWMETGFVHGALNTDNILVTGETIDLNVFGFLDPKEEGDEEDYAPNFIDVDKVFSYSNQMEALRWGMEQMALTLAPELVEVVNEVWDSYQQEQQQRQEQEHDGWWDKDKVQRVCKGDAEGDSIFDELVEELKNGRTTTEKSGDSRKRSGSGKMKFSCGSQ